MNELGQGLTLSGIGILITFSALGILIILILILKALFPERREKTVVSGLEETRSSSAGPERESLRKQAAAAGVAVLLRNRSNTQKGGLGSELEKPVSKWWLRGLDRTHNKERL